MKYLCTLLFCIILSVCCTAQNNVEISTNIFAGSRAWQTDSLAYATGANHGIAVWLYPEYNPDMEIHIFGQASAEYTSVYVPRIDEILRFVHVKGGIGITNSTYIFASLNLGYLSNISGNAESVPAIDGQLTISFPGQNKWMDGKLAVYLTGLAGTTFYNPYYLKTTRSLGYFAGAIGARYVFNVDKEKEKILFFNPEN